MLISRNILQTFFTRPLPDAEVIARELTMKSFEVEGVETVGNDQVLNVDILPNRASDCLSHFGVAREVALACNLELDNPYAVSELPEKNGDSIPISLDPNTTQRFIAVSLAGLDNTKESPEWLKTALGALGERSVSPIVDITNYVMLITGQPLHAYDADKLEKVSESNAISFHVGFAQAGETLRTLDHVEHTLYDSALVIRTAEAGEILGLAGIKGGESTAVDATTKRIVLEAACFNPTLVRKSAQSTKLHTSASKRFENSIPRELASLGIEHALKHFTDLFPEHTLEAISDTYPEKVEPTVLTLDPMHTSRLLGITIAKEQQRELLESVGCVIKDFETDIVVIPPWHRPDLVRPVDLVEEIGRLFGYSAIDAIALPPLLISLAESAKQKELLRDVLAEKGFSEIITRSFRTDGEVLLENPLAKNTPFLRKDLSKGLEDALIFNSQNAELLELEYVRLFEIGTIFTNEKEVVHLAIGIHKTKNARTKISLTKELNELEAEFSGRYNLSLDKYFLAETQGDQLLIREYTLENLQFPTKDFSPRDITTPFSAFKQFSVYPYVLRDIAVWTPEGTTPETVESFIRKNLGEELRVVTLFDRFEKEIEGTKKVSYAFKLVFQSFEKTLSDEEIGGQMSALEKGFAAIPGYAVR